jgi:hypothetical protein
MHRVKKLEAGIRRALNFKAQVLSRLKGACSALPEWGQACAYPGPAYRPAIGARAQIAARAGVSVCEDGR